MRKSFYTIKLYWIGTDPEDLIREIRRKVKRLD